MLSLKVAGFGNRAISVMILSTIHSHPIPDSSTDNIDLQKRRFIVFGYFLPGCLHLVVADDTVLLHPDRIHFASLYSTSVSNNCYSSFRVVVSIHHFERQKSQGDSAIIDTIDNLHTLRSRNRRQHGSLRTKNTPLCTPLGVRRQVKTLYLIHLNEVPQSTPYHYTTASSRIFTILLSTNSSSSASHKQ
mgnify:CR=1 FL=1